MLNTDAIILSSIFDLWLAEFTDVKPEAIKDL
jgi:hypothetical protein